MKWISVFLCLMFVFSGCISKKEKKDTLGPLAKINEFQVIPVFTSNQASERQVLLDHLVESLKKLGMVHISTDCMSEGPASSAGFVIAIGELAQAKTGSINIFAEAEIVINKHKTSCEAWTTFYQDPTLPYAVDEEDGIAFKRDPTAVSPDLKTVITQMVEQFSEQYRQDNPGSKPTFQVYSQMFSAIPAKKIHEEASSLLTAEVKP